MTEERASTCLRAPAQNFTADYWMEEERPLQKSLPHMTFLSQVTYADRDRGVVFSRWLLSRLGPSGGRLH